MTDTHDTRPEPAEASTDIGAEQPLDAASGIASSVCIGLCVWMLIVVAWISWPTVRGWLL